MSKSYKKIKTTIKHLRKRVSKLKDEIKEIEIKIDRAWSDKSLEKLYKKIWVKRKELKYQQERLAIYDLADFYATISDGNNDYWSKLKTNKENK